MPTRDRPLLTEAVNRPEQFVPARGSAYVFGTSVEDRSHHALEWQKRAQGVSFVPVVSQGENSFRSGLDGIDEVSLRSAKQVATFWEEVGTNTVYLDITGLAHHIWAPLLRGALAARRRTMVVYVEPSEYRFSATPTEGEIFDLSERISGIAPIAGFVSLLDSGEEDFCFVPLLGFEGTRLAYLVEHVQPPGDRVVPVIGVPGFRPEYPFYAYHGNRSVLTETRAWKNVRFAVANCPFSLFYLLEDIAEEYPHAVLKIAPIGTKPQALGAVMYAIASPKRVEIVYDHPVRKAKRTEGCRRLLLYHVSEFLGG